MRLPQADKHANAGSAAALPGMPHSGRMQLQRYVYDFFSSQAGTHIKASLMPGWTLLARATKARRGVF